MGMVEVGWLSSVPYLAATIAMIVVSWASDKMQNRKLFVWPLLLIAAFAFIGSWAVGANHFWVSYTLLVIAGAAMYAPTDRSSPSFLRCCRATSPEAPWP
jgi:sugar phosphate permease